MTGPGRQYDDVSCLEVEHLALRSTDARRRWRLAGSGEPVTVVAPVAELVAYLAGRPATVATATGDPAPTLPAWL